MRKRSKKRSTILAASGLIIIVAIWFSTKPYSVPLVSVAEAEQLYFQRKGTETQVGKIAAQVQANFQGTGVVAQAVQAAANSAIQVSKSGKDEALMRLLAAKVDESADRADFLLATFSDQLEAAAAAKTLHELGIRCVTRWFPDSSGAVVSHRIMIATADRSKITKEIVSALGKFKPVRGWNIGPFEAEQ